jgi:hypothetical protein
MPKPTSIGKQFRTKDDAYHAGYFAGVLAGVELTKLLVVALLDMDEDASEGLTSRLDTLDLVREKETTKEERGND